MPVYTFANSFQTTLSASLAAAATSLTPASTTGAPSADPTAVPATQFRLVVQSAAYPTSGTREIITVSDSRTGTWTLLTGPTNSYSSGDTIAGAVTAIELGQFEQLVRSSGRLRARFVSQQLYTTATPQSGQSGTNNQITFATFFVDATTAFDQIGCNVAATGNAGAVIRLGIYNADATGIPSTLVLDAGTVVGDSGTGLKTITISQTLAPGLYFLAAGVQSAATTAPTIWTNSTGQTVVQYPLPAAVSNFGNFISGYYQTGVSGALPSTATPVQAPSGGSPQTARVFMRAA